MALVKNIADINPRESIKKGTVATKIGMERLKPFTRDVSEVERAEFSGGSKFRNGDTIMARITPCLENGKTAKVNCLEDGEVGFGSTEYIVFRAKEGVTDPDYLYYLICSPVIRDPAIKSMVGSSGRQRVQTEVIENLDLKIPSFENQKKIGKILSKIDDKIQVNNQINMELNKLADSIYAKKIERFLINNEVPEGWKNVRFGDLVEITTSSFNPKKAEEIMLEHYSIPAFDEKHFPVFESSTSIKSNKYKIDKNCLLISKLNPNIKRIWWPYCMTDNSVCSTEFIVYKAKNVKHNSFYYAMMNSKDFGHYMCAHVTGSTGSRQRTTPGDTLEYRVLMPPIKELELLIDVFDHIYEQIKNNDIENYRLASLREHLMPQLMSGKIDVSELEI